MFSQSSTMHLTVWATSDDGKIEFVALTKDRLNEVVSLYHHAYFKYESMSITTGLSADAEGIREFDQLLIDIASDGVSVVAIEKQTGEIVGCSLNKLQQVKDNGKKRSIYENISVKSPAAKLYQEINVKIDEILLDVFGNLQTNCYLECQMGVLLPTMKSRGLGQKLVEASTKIAQNLKNGNNVKVSINEHFLPLHPVPTDVIACPTSSKSKNTMEKMEFTLVAEVNLMDAIDMIKLNCAKIEPMYIFKKALD